MAESSDAPARRPEGAPPLVGIGASAGGIEALRTFFMHVRADDRAAYVVILHLSPDHESRLAEVLQSASALPVQQVKERVRIEPGHVYVVPPNQFLTIDLDAIDVGNVTSREERRAPVDLFFRSLADADGAQAVCVVLSGTGPDGSSGLKRVKEYGGLVIAQDPVEAEYDEMPCNAIATGMVDFVLPLSQMPNTIRAYHRRAAPDSSTGGAFGPPAPDPDAMREIHTLLRLRTGHDFSSYKQATVQRRLERRLHVHGVHSLAEYAGVIRQVPAEAGALMKELLISVTNFFRDPEAFQTLADRVVPHLFLNKTRQDQLRVWVPGCATGEEAYSIAMLLAEHCAAMTDAPSIQLFATDLDDQALLVARNGLYTAVDVAEISEARLARFFTQEERGFRIRRELRETVLFAHHNVIKDPPFSHIDLISCRNVLIYLTRSIQERVIDTFHFALRPEGFLFLGTSETPAAGAFAVADARAHLYQARAVRTRTLTSQPESPNRASATPVAPLRSSGIVPAELHQRLLEAYAPPSIVVKEDHQIIHVSERGGRYLRVAGGEPTRDLLRLLRPGLQADVRSALYDATRDKQPVHVANVPATLEDGEGRVNIAVYPVFEETEAGRGYLLLTFQEQRGAPVVAPHHPPGLPTPLALQLEEEVAKLRSQLRATIEQYETQAEEAKAANEELQALNEELRSSGEELETSREELQSLNEELSTVNQELKVKIEELGLTNNDFQNLLNASDVGTIFLDRDMRVKLATPAANALFNLLPSDAGRPLTDITSRFTDDTLHEDVLRVLADLRTLDREVQTRDGRWIVVRLRPYRTTDDRIEGVVITFQDTTAQRLVENQLRRGEERLRMLIDGAPDYAIFTMTDNGVIDSWNLGAERMFGYGVDEIVGRGVALLFTPEDRAAGVVDAELQMALTTGRAPDERYHVRKDGSRFYCSGTTTRLTDGLGLAKIARDLTERQNAADALRAAHADLENRVRQRTDQLTAEVQATAAAHQRVSDLVRKLVTAQEDERRRIARDLHDQLGQQLTALRLHLQGIAARLGNSSDAAAVKGTLEIVDRLDADLDYLLWELRPAVLDDLGLAAALPLLVREWSDHYGIQAEYRATGFTAGHLGADAEVVCYRIVQEALTNVIKHAHASRVEVLLESRDGSVRLLVEDDGVGFNADQVADRGIGLAGMRERANLIGAALEVESAPGKGTSVFLRCLKPAASPDESGG